MSGLFDDLCAYDGKAVTLLSEAEKRHGSGPAYITELVVLSASDVGHVSNGATWLLKAAAENGVALTPDQTRALIQNLPEICDWLAQLHICQMLGFMAVPAAGAANVAAWLSDLLGHKRPFLRAWSMSALCSLAAQHADFASQAEAALEVANADPAASVRARARGAEKAYQPLGRRQR